MNFLKSLFDYEKEKKEIYDAYINLGTGIACPCCGEELHESNSMVLLMSNPPRKNVYCKMCKSKYTITA